MSEYPQPGLHPDPDTLNAFVEGVLPEHERLACLTHFADCAACREVVWLAQDALPQEPPSREPLPVRASGKGFGWRRWLTSVPALSAAAVTGALVLSVALFRPDRPASNTSATLAATSAPKAAGEAATVASPKQQETAVQKTLATPRAAPPSGNQDRNPHPIFALRAREVAERPAMIPKAQPAQQAAITGRITDAAGGVVPDAAVTVRQASGAPGANAITDRSGQFFIAGLQPGQYELQVARAGFQAETRKIEVRPDQVARADSSLSVGSVAESVEVTASAPTVGTEAALPAKGKSGLAAVPLIGRMVMKSSAPTDRDSVSLPSRLVAVAMASIGKVTLAADSAGVLYRSDNETRKWKAVKAVWQGKVVELTSEPPASGTTEFRMKTDAGTVWLSRDGNRWFLTAPQQ
jgi:hypothetical protein